MVSFSVLVFFVEYETRSHSRGVAIRVIDKIWFRSIFTYKCSQRIWFRQIMLEIKNYDILKGKKKHEKTKTIF